MSAPNVSELTQVGMILGTSTYGTGAATILRGIMATAFDVGANHGTEPIKTLRADMSIQRVSKGTLDYDVNMSFPLDVGDSIAGCIADFLACLLGEDTGVNLGSSKYKHTLKCNSSAEPPWLNLWSNKDNTNKQVTGVRISSIKLALNAAEGWIKVDVTGKAKDEATLSTQTLTFSTAPLLSPNMVSAFTIGGASVANFDTCEITFTNELEGFYPLQNARTKTNLFRKSVLVEVMVSGINFTDEVERTKAKNVASSAFALTLTDADANYISFVFPETYYKEFKDPPIGGSDLLKISANMFVTGAIANWYVELKNGYAKEYHDGSAIV